MGSLAMIGPALSIGGTLLSMRGQQQAGEAAARQAQVAAQNERTMANFEAKQADYLANQSQAVAQKEAAEQRRIAVLVASKTLAYAAASGASASDPSVVDILSGIYAEGAYRSALALYEGEEQARSYKVAAAARRASGQSAASAALFEGASTQRASQMSMFSTLLSGAGSLFDSFSGSK